MRYDLHRMDGIEEMPDGTLRIPARVAKVGVLRYEDGAGKSWGELVTPDVLFDPESMATLRGVAVTDLHPGEAVTPKNRAALQRGHASDDVRRDGDYLATPVYVTDAAEIDLVKRGERRDVSCGYACDTDERAGVFDGEPYERVQTRRIYNHLGLGPEGWGRAGTDVSLRLDGGAAATRFDAPKARADQSTGGGGRTPATTEKTMPIKKKDGEEQSDPKQADDEMVAKKDADEAMAKVEAKHAAEITAIKEVLNDALTKLAALEASEKAEVTEADVPETVADSIVAKRLAKLDAAREGARLVLGPKLKVDGLTVRELHAKVIAASLPETKLDGLSDGEVAGMAGAFIGAARAKAAKHTDGKNKVAEVLGADKDQADDVAREDGATEYDPIAHQRSAMKSWSAKPTAKGSA